MSEPVKARKTGSPDWVLLAAVAALLLIGLMVVYSSSYDMSYLEYNGDSAYFLKRQAAFAAIGTLFMIVASKVPYRHWMKVSVAMMFIVLVLLVVQAVSGRGRQMLGQSISPVEFAKLAIIIYIGHWLASKRVEQLRRLPVGPLPFAIIVGGVAGLVMAQRDLSEAAVIVLVAVVMYFLAGADLLQFAIGALGGAAAFLVVIQYAPRAMARIEPFLLAWQDPLQSTNQQLRQGIIALGYGGIFGLGPGNGRGSLGGLPAAHTDSIFAVVGEELGLVGCLIVLGLFALLVYRGFQAYRRAPDAFGSLVAAGVTCWIAFEALINVAVVTNTMPFTGTALPFISVGGSSLITCMTGVGVLLNISKAAGSNQEGAPA